MTILQTTYYEIVKNKAALAARGKMTLASLYYNKDRRADRKEAGADYGFTNLIPGSCRICPPSSSRSRMAETRALE
jgi:hypothetical protein